MAKKKANPAEGNVDETTQSDETEEIVNVEQEQSVDTSETEIQTNVGTVPETELDDKPWSLKLGGQNPTPEPDERRYAVSFSLPYGVLVALLDPDHVDADVAGAKHFGLYDPSMVSVALTPIGQIVARSFDAIAVGHKMSAAFRAAHNAGLDRRK